MVDALIINIIYFILDYYYFCLAPNIKEMLNVLFYKNQILLIYLKCK